jgi:hypothetical protein
MPSFAHAAGPDVGLISVGQIFERLVALLDEALNVRLEVGVGQERAERRVALPAHPRALRHGRFAPPSISKHPPPPEREIDWKLSLMEQGRERYITGTVNSPIINTVLYCTDLGGPSNIEARF